MQFYCVNSGHQGASISSSFVNDGICGKYYSSYDYLDIQIVVMALMNTAPSRSVPITASEFQSQDNTPCVLLSVFCYSACSILAVKKEFELAERRKQFEDGQEIYKTYVEKVSHFWNLFPKGCGPFISLLFIPRMV